MGLLCTQMTRLDDLIVKVRAAMNPVGEAWALFRELVARIDLKKRKEALAQHEESIVGDQSESQ